MNAAFGGSESARQPFRPIWPADRPTDGGPALAAALNNAHAAISQDLLPPAPALAYGHASDPPYSACSSPDSMSGMAANACDTTGNSLSPAQAYLLGVDLVSPFLCKQGTCQEGCRPFAC